MTPSRKQIQEAEAIRKKFKNRSWLIQWREIEEEEKQIREIRKSLADIKNKILKLGNKKIGETEPIRTTEL